jgi:hypothetical protein
MSSTQHTGRISSTQVRLFYQIAQESIVKVQEVVFGHPRETVSL